LFKLSTAKLSLLLLAFSLVPSGRIYADTGDSVDIVTGPDPAPTGNPNTIIGSPLWLEMELAIMMAL